MSPSDLPRVEVVQRERPVADPSSQRLTREEEGALVDRLLAGDERAFEEFSDRYFPGLYRFALRVLGGDEELATELVQVTVCKVVAKLDSFRRESSLFTWLCACCRNEIRMHFRTQGRRPKQVDLEDPGIQGAPAMQLTGPDRVALRKESSALVHRTLDDLPPHYAQALEWKYIEKLSVAEIGQRFEIGAKAAESLLTRARAAFRTSFEQLNSPLETRPDGGLLGGSQ